MLLLSLLKMLVIVVLFNNNGRVMQYPEMVKLVTDHLKAKKMCKHAVKKLPYLLRYVPD